MVDTFHILIAEDEPHIALALSAVIKKGIVGSSVVVENNGQEAWNKLLSADFNLIISDWNMPNMTGVELLNKVRASAKYKEIPFLMLTARGDKDSVMAAMKGGVTQYIAKPFENKIIVEKVLSLLKSGHLISAVKSNNVSEKKIESIIFILARRLKDDDIEFPVMPDIGMRAAELSRSNDISIEALSSLILQDAALSSKLISIANSPHYNAGKGFDSIEDAITRIGLRDVSMLIVAISSKNMFQKASGFFAEKLDLLWDHSFATASCAKIIAQNIGANSPDRLFSLGLLHDIGKLVLLTVLFELSAKRKMDKAGLDETISQLHVRFGKAIVERWDMPTDFISAVVDHHDDGNMAAHTQETQIVAFANIMVRKLGYSLVEDDDSSLVDTELVKLLNLDESKIEKIQEQTEKYIISMKSAV